MHLGQTLGHAQPEPNGEDISSAGSSVQSHAEALTQTGRTSTPCSSRRARSAPAHKIPSAARSAARRKTHPDDGISARRRHRRSARNWPRGFPGNHNCRSLRSARRFVRRIPACSRSIMPLIILSRKLMTPPVNLKVAMLRRSCVGLARREAGADDGHLHRLLLKQRHAEGFFQHAVQVPAWDTRPFPDPRAAADRDAPCRPGSGPGRTIAT